MAPTLATEVRLLEEAYASLHTMHGELLATLTQPNYRYQVRRHPETALDVMFGVVDKAKEKFESMPAPQPS